MIELGKYSVRGKICQAEVIETTDYHAIGWLVFAQQKIPAIWNARGHDTLGRSQYDLCIPITIHAELPEPMREEPEYMTDYFIADLTGSGNVVKWPWCGDYTDNVALRNGCAHRTREAAEQWMKFWQEQVVHKQDDELSDEEKAKIQFREWLGSKHNQWKPVFAR